MADRSREEVREDVIRAAKVYRAWGMSVFPLAGDKKPISGWEKLQRRRMSERMLEFRFRFAEHKRGIAQGVAAIHGSASRFICCRDFDDADAYHRWAESHPDVASVVPTVRTVRGFHVWFRWKYQSYQWMKDGSGEYRGTHGQYTALPPSARPDKDGFVYHWHRNEPSGYTSFPIIDPVRHGLRWPYTPRDFKRFHPPDWMLSGGRFTDANAVSFCDSNSLYLSHPQIIATEEACTVIGQHDPVAEPVSDDHLPVAVRNAILMTQPWRVGERRRHIFLFAKRLKALRPDAEADDWRDAMAAWFRRAKWFVGTKDYGTSWDDFVSAWRDCRPQAEYPSNPLTRAKLAAADVSDNTERVMAVCRVLAEASETGEFMLASTLAGDLTGLPQKTAHNALARLVKRGLLVVANRSQRGNYGVGSTYRLAATEPATAVTMDAREPNGG